MQEVPGPSQPQPMPLEPLSPPPPLPPFMYGDPPEQVPIAQDGDDTNVAVTEPTRNSDTPRSLTVQVVTTEGHKSSDDGTTNNHYDND
ncbi:hypothetical protein MTO96_006755 [Rhipicephalus appendiculatus]